MNAVRTLVAGAVLVSIALSGCGGEDDGAGESASAQEPISVLPTEPTAAAREAVRDRDSAARAVLELWSDLKAGAVPVAVLAYHPDVTESVGASPLAATLAALQGTVAPYEPRIIDVEPTRVGSLVLMRAIAKNGPAVEHAYVLRREGRRWRVTYDTLVGRNIEALVAREQAALEGDVERPSQRARRAGADAAREFRDAGLGS